MKLQKQRIFDKENGDCFRACLATILEEENGDDFVKIKTEGWIIPYRKKLAKMGLSLGYEKDAVWREGYWIATVPSLNFKETNHAIIMLGTKVFFDPSTHKKYAKGSDLLGKNIVLFGYWIEVSDFSRLKRYLQNQAKEKQNQGR